MGFTTACFIRRDTPKLRIKLKKLGYNSRCNEQGNYLRTFYKNTIGENAFFATLNVPLEGIDCEYNEELFLAIAALRDDTSDNQYWVFNEDFEKYKKGDFAIGHFTRCSCYCHKATVEELIGHFKK